MSPATSVDQLLLELEQKIERILVRMEEQRKELERLQDRVRDLEDRRNQAVERLGAVLDRIQSLH